MPKFSIIVPVYRSEKYLETCIKSVISQKYTDFEMVLVDDGSDDASPLICDRYAKSDKRIIVIHQKNSGVVNARQSGVKVATGEYIVPLDSDDYISENYLSLFNDVIEKTHPDIAMCGYYEGNDKNWKRAVYMMEAGFYDKSAIVEHIFPNLICNNKGKSIPQMLWGKVFLSTLYKKYQLVDTYVTMGEDSACVIPMISNANSCYIIHSSGYYYRNNPASITKGKKAFPFDGPLIRAEHIRKYVNLDESDLYNQYYRMILLSSYTVIASRYSINMPIMKIDDEIKDYLRNPIIYEAINKCHFSYSKFNLVFRKIVLKYQSFKMIHFFCRIHK